jgi:hypothetical protein
LRNFTNIEYKHDKIETPPDQTISRAGIPGSEKDNPASLIYSDNSIIQQIPVQTF